MGNPIVHFEIAGRNGPELESFYARMFGWEVAHEGSGAMQYGFIKDGSAGPVGGGFRHEPEGHPEIVLYVEVDDLESAVQQAESLGATVRIHPIDTGEITFALIVDPEGNPIGMIQK